MATYCVGDLAFMVDGTNSQGEQFRNHLYRLIFLLRRRFLFLSRRLNEWWDFPVFFSANNYWIIIGGGSQFSLGKRRHQILFLRYRTNETDRQRDREDIRLSVCLSVSLFFCLSVCLLPGWDEFDEKRQQKPERERERERENSPERIRRRISVLLKSRPRVCWTKKDKKKFLSRKRHFNYFLEEWRKKNITK